jgi:hypothetical protein
LNIRVGAFIFGIVLVAFAAACGSGASEPEPVTDYPYSGLQMFEDIGDREHFQPGLNYDEYNSNPPTSGPHSGVFESWGVFEQPVPKEVGVHNMEHAGVVVWYNCEGGSEPLSADDCATLKNSLTALVQPQISDGASILMTPYAAMTGRIALTGWQYLDTFDEYDETRVQTFIDTFECRFDPENFC